MSTAPSTSSTIQTPVSVPPRGPHPLHEILSEVAQAISPVWPLQDYVAVNPFAGITHRSFLDVRAFLKVFSDCETLMPVAHYATLFRQGRFAVADIESAIAEIQSSGLMVRHSASDVAAQLAAVKPQTKPLTPKRRAANPNRRLKTIAEYIASPAELDWTEVILEEVSRHCAAHYDQGQASWSSPHQQQSLYTAWRAVAEHDRNIEILGLPGFRRFASRLPATPEAAIIQSLRELNVPQRLWSTFLLCQAFSMPGWCAWAKYQSHWSRDAAANRNDLTGLLAIRLAYDTALSHAKSIRVNWDALVQDESVSFASPLAAPGDDSMLRYTLLRAAEIGYRNELLASLSLAAPATQPVGDDHGKLAQMVFCIDVRSERIRRQLETHSSSIETMGFAGFFGMAFDYVPLGAESGCSHLPVLLKPQFQVFAGFSDDESGQAKDLIQQRRLTGTWHKLWKGFQSSAIGCFSFVETLGLLYGAKLLRRSAGRISQASPSGTDGSPGDSRDSIGPTLRGLNHQGIETSRQADLAEGLLRNLGLTSGLAKLVVFCGHASQTENNPLAAGLDCGACGGHSGEPNARFAALLLNQHYIRKALSLRGIEIPDGTHFLAAVHNTTTDAIRLFDLDQVPNELADELQQLMETCHIASEQTRIERLPTIGSTKTHDVFRRASDWSEVRPEWGLAGNAAFVAAPRSITSQTNLDARAFLHSYDYRQDPDGKILETIMTAPMVVAHWINMQYYASTVDNRYFGSGSKTVHNVVGRFGILSGNGGDLMTGLPLQSLSSGEGLQHLPMRLQVVLGAPRTMIEKVIASHDLVSDLLSGGWLHLVAIEDECLYRYNENGTWTSLELAHQSQPTTA